MSNPLDPIMEWRLSIIDSLQIATSVVGAESRRRGIITRDSDSSFFGLSEKEAKLRIDNARGQVDDLVVLALVATFERTIRDYLLRLPCLILQINDPVDLAVRTQLSKDLEFWRLSDQVVPTFKDRVPKNIQMLVIQIIDYRNWVAHGRSEKKPAKANVVPPFAYKKLTEFLDLAGIL